MVSEPDKVGRSREPGPSRHWIVLTGRVLALSLLGGFLTGAGMALAKLGDFSYMPAFLGYLMALVTGGFIGMLTRRLSHGLTALLLTILVSAAVSTLALSYPEFELNRLGLDIAVEVSVLQGLTSSLFSLPFIIVGLFGGKFLARFD